MPLGRSDVSRVEGFSDAVFGFALTLLVVSTEVPADYADLKAAMAGFLPFAATFAIIVWIWYEHYLLFRRFHPEDGLTIVLNAVLLFVVLFYVYPLKFMFAALLGPLGGVPADASGAFRRMTAAEGRQLMTIYSLGFIAVFGVLALLYLHVRRRLAEERDALATFDAGAGAARHAVSVGVGLVSLLLTLLLPARWLALAGMSFVLLGPAHACVGLRSGRARARVSARLTSTPAA